MVTLINAFKVLGYTHMEGAIERQSVIFIIT